MFLVGESDELSHNNKLSYIFTYSYLSCILYDVYNVHVMYIVHLLYVVHLNHIMMKCVAYPYLIIKYHLINNYLIKRSNIGCSNC